MAGGSQPDSSEADRDGPGRKRWRWYTWDLLAVAWAGPRGRRPVSARGPGTGHGRAGKTQGSGYIAPELRCQPCVSVGCHSRVRRVTSGRVLVVPPRRTYPSKGAWLARAPTSSPRHQATWCPWPAVPHAASHVEVRTPALGPARSAPAGKKSVPRRVAVTRIFPWTLHRRSRVKAPVPLVSKICPESKWTGRTVAWIMPRDLRV